MKVLLRDEQRTGQVPAGTANLTRGTRGVEAMAS